MVVYKKIYISDKNHAPEVSHWQVDLMSAYVSAGVCFQFSVSARTLPVQLELSVLLTCPRNKTGKGAHCLGRKTRGKQNCCDSH